MQMEIFKKITYFIAQIFTYFIVRFNNNNQKYIPIFLFLIFFPFSFSMQLDNRLITFKISVTVIETLRYYSFRLKLKYANNHVKQNIYNLVIYIYQF